MGEVGRFVTCFTGDYPIKLGALEEQDDEIKANGGKATIVELDMHDYGAIPRLAAAINGRWGKLDGFVANAAMLGPLTPLSHLDESVWNDTIAVNLTAQWHLIKAMEPLLLKASAGRAVWFHQVLLRASDPFGGHTPYPKPDWKQWAASGRVRPKRQICALTS